ncbi:MAG: hypothetical protein PHH28_06675 [Desulfuromonadaceae bacterium]|nr:hypothetical protein [Desulfuromonadaceae bacterium]
MLIVRVSSIVLLIALCAGTLLLSQLDNATTGKVYSSVSQMMHIDLKALQIDTVQISNGGHIAAGFVVCGLAQLIVRRWWVLPLAMCFFLGVEAAQLFSAERQADWLDVLRGWGGCLGSRGLIAAWERIIRAK